ncbi:MAG: hypothetical protein HYX47_02955 [Burkholderiales bacterium]|nr:hypothetical protein [Burkholderiales bacterium]
MCAAVKPAACTDSRFAPAIRLAAAFLIGGAALSCWAQESERSGLDIAATALPDNPAPARLEVSSGVLPRIDGATRGERADRVERIDMSLLSPGNSGLGFAVGLSNLSPPNAPMMGTQLDLAPGLSLGVQWRHTLEGRNRIDITAWRSVTPPTDAISLIQQRQPVYGARVEMSLAPLRKTGLVVDRGFIGLQLESGARVTLKRNGGKPMMYYRNKF